MRPTLQAVSHPFIIRSLAVTVVFAVFLPSALVADGWVVDLGPANNDVEELVKQRALHCINMMPSEVPAAAKRLPALTLAGRDLRRAELHVDFAILPNVTFDGANLSGAAIDETNFVRCSFRRAILRSIYSHGDIHDDCDLTDADITGSRLLITREQLRSTKNYKDKNLSGTILSGDFSGVSFAGFNLRGTVFDSCDLSRCDFTDADIAQAAIDSQTEAGQPPAKRVFTKEQLYSTKSYKERNLDQVIFRNCDFRDADLSDQNLGHFVSCDLTHAKFANADFPFPLSSQYPYIPDSREKWIMHLGSSYGFTNCGLTAEQFYSTRTYKSAKLPMNFALEKMNLDGWNFSDMDLSCVSFRDSSLKGANLTDARNGDFKFAKNLTLEQITSTRNYENDDMKVSVGDRPVFRLPKELVEALQRGTASERKGAKQ